LKDNLNIEELFAEKLSHHESPVRADLWQGIQAQMAAQGVAGSSTVATKGISLATKWVVGIASSVVLTGAVIYATSTDDKQVAKTEFTSNSEVAKKSTPVLSSERVETENSNSKVTEESKSLVKNATSSTQASEGTFVETTPLIVKQREPEVDQKVTTLIDPAFEKGVKPKDNETTSFFEGTETAQKEVIGKISKLPNVISPNDDQINDYLSLKCENLKEFTITIMNQRNEVVYSSTDIHFKWYGDRDGVRLPVGTYYYFVTAIDEHNHKINKYNTLDIRY
jgi:gliding motility-associated-like protein